MTTYSELKKNLAAIASNHEDQKRADDRYYSNGRYEQGELDVKAAHDALNAATIDMTGKTDPEILVEFLKIAETAETHDDFMETGHSFPDRHTKAVVRYGLITWVAEMFNENSAALLDGVQRVIDVMPDNVEGWSLSGDKSGAEADIRLITEDDYNATALTPAIALTSAILQAMVAHPKPVIKKLPGL